MQKSLISVIVPIYNVEKYLTRCLDSIENQTYDNLEIILINDGSTDTCGKICDDYAHRDKRIKVIHKENGGLSEARNVGLNVMRGDYVTCIDSDDFISNYYIENLWKALNFGKCDIAISSFINYYEGDKIPAPFLVQKNEINVLNREELYKHLLYQDGIDISAYGKLYKAELFDNVRYPVGKLYEDILTTYRLLERVEKIAYIKNVDYYYFQRSTSISKTSFSEKKMDAVNNMKEFVDYIVLNYPELKNAANCRYFSTVCNILFLIDGDRFKEQRIYLWNEIKKYRWKIALDPYGRKKARVAAIISYAGYHAMLFAYKTLKSLRLKYL